MRSDHVLPAAGPTRDFLAEGGEMGGRMRAHDWSTSPLGQPETWPQSLRSLVRLMLNAKQAMFVAWGPHLGFLYNDGYAPIFGAKHPHALGRPFAEVWSDIWDQISPLVESTLSGEAVGFEDLLIPMERNGYREEAYFTFSYTPVHDEADRVAGMFCAVIETTGKVLAERRIATERERLRELFHQAPGFIAVLRGPDHVFEIANASYDQLVGHRNIIGRPALEALPELAGQGFQELLDRVYESGEPFVGRGLRVLLRREPNSEPEERFVDFVYQPIRDAAGRVSGIFAEGSDVTEAKRAEAALRESETRLKLALDAGRLAVWESNTAEDRITTSPELNRLLGFPPDSTPGTEEIRARYHPGDREKIAAVAREAIARGERYAEGEMRVVRPDGTIRWLLLRAELQPSPQGRVGQTVGVALDITERKRAEEHQRLLINELNHRVKNTLATVQSIAAQTLRNAGTTEEARSALESRLFALSRAHDVLTRENWEGAGLRAIVTEALAPFRGAWDERFHIRGPDVWLSPRMALALAMALQELSTNAVKYGALSRETGRIAIEWQLAQETGHDRLHLAWTESGGPPVSPPKRRGFGTRLIERSLAQDLNGEVRIAFTETGVVCTVDAPVG
ncbi:PAS domain-containing sensor histidine kinase [Microvirga subterranea]|uniref:Blue-light-activated histidine kinase n=1 Tax=Microvirga subterranea TaxID=186651 RepID=A0A370HUU9_9HYPH|nr:HWE histidine kinase domain-containing protein [Microvirga subterranea]RDI62282.1 PAS domain S-box-containing protein [Microvirga subterranea]